MRRFPTSGSRRIEMDTKDNIYVPLRCRNAFAHYISIILARKRVQSYSDQELFWIISNGIRFTGMPGSARLKLRTIFGVWSITCGDCRAEPRARMPAEFEIALCS